MANLGDLVIKVGGNIDGFKASMTEASASADQFTARIAATVSQGVTLFDAYGRAIESRVSAPLAAAKVQLTAFQRAAAEVAAAEAAMAVEANAAAVSTARLGAAAEASGFNFRYAFFGVKDLMEGRFKFALAEAANEAVRMGGAVLTIGSAVAGVAAAVFGFVELAKYFGGMSEAQLKIRDAFAAFNSEVRISNEELQVTNDKLENEIAKIQHKPENGIKLALDEAILSADQLAKSINKDLVELEKLLKEHGVGIGGQIFGQAPTSDIEEQIKHFRREVAAVSEKGNIPRVDSIGGVQILSPQLLEHQKEAAQLKTNTDLTRLYSDELRKLNHELQTALQPPSGATVDSGKRVELLTGAIANLKEEAKSIGLKTDNAELKGTLATAQQTAESARLVKEETKKEEETLKAAYNQELADMEAHGVVSAGKKLSFRQQELDSVSRWGDKYRDLVRSLATDVGHLSQEVDKGFNAVVARGVKVSEEAAKKGEQAKQKMEALVLEAEDVLEKIRSGEQALQTKLSEIGIKSTAAGQEGAGEFKKLALERQFGLSGNNTPQARIAFEEKLLGIEREIAQVKIAALTAEQATETDPVKKAEMGLKLQEQIIAAAEKEYVAETRITEEKRKQAISFQVQQAAQRVPAALGGALSAGIFSGKNIGQDIANSLKGIGQQLLGNIFTRLITTTLTHIAATVGLTAATTANTGVTTLHAGTMLTHAGVMLTHMAAVVFNTIATIANTLWTAILTAVETVKAFFGFADGGRPPVGVPSWVGESGKELFVPDQPGTIIPNHALNFRGSSAVANISSSSSSVNSGGNTFNFHGVQDVRGMMRSIASVAKTASPKFSPFAT